MRPILRGLVAAAALSLAPVAVVTTSVAPANAAATVDTTYASSPATQRTSGDRVYRTIDIQSVPGKRKPTADVKVTPKFAKKLLTIQKKMGKGFTTIKKVRTNERGKVRISVEGSRKGIKYRLVAPGNKKFLATKAIITATVY